MYHKSLLNNNNIKSLLINLLIYLNNNNIKYNNVINIFSIIIILNIIMLLIYLNNNYIERLLLNINNIKRLKVLYLFTHLYN